jgi:RNA polymerase sigma factor (sigma-70 family)
MCIVHPLDLEGPVVFGCAQAGCQACLEALLEKHNGLIHAVLQQQARGGVRYEDLVQEGRIALWQAIVHFDPHRGTAFSTYAWVAIQRRIWQAVARQRRRAHARRGQGSLSAPPSMDPLAQAERAWWQARVRQAVGEAVSRLPERLRQIVVAAYGLNGLSPHSLAAIGRRLGISRDRVRQLRNDALVLLRLPLFSARLRCLCDQNSRAAYIRAQALNRAWLRQRRGRRGA